MVLMKLYLAHPGENDGNNLTSKGEWQIKTLARRLNTDSIKVNRVYSNGHSVSTQSGDILSRTLTTPLIHDERFVEINKSFIEGFFNESEIENLDYIHLFADEIVSKCEDAILVLGDGIHRAVISRLTGMPLSATRHFSLSPGSISVLSGSTGSWRIDRVNDTNHIRLP